MHRFKNINIEGINQNCIVRIDDSVAFADIIEELSTLLSQNKNFFNGSSLVIDLRKRQLTEKDCKELIYMFHELFRVKVNAVVCSDPLTIKTLHQLGITTTDNDFTNKFQGFTNKFQGLKPKKKERPVTEIPGFYNITSKLKLTPQSNTSKSKPTLESSTSKSKPTPQSSTSKSKLSTHTDSIKSVLLNAKLVYATLRSGQVMESKGSLVIVGDVNPGAEVRAEGDIVVIGSLRGMAHAGLQDNNKAKIIALHLCPTLIKIGTCIAGAPSHMETKKTYKPEVAFIENNQIIIEELI